MALKGWDIQGRAIRDFYEGDHQAQLGVYSASLGHDKIPAGVFFRGLAQLSDLEQYALSLCHGKVLDVGAGAGCHSLILQKEGLAVQAIDISPDAVRVMRERGVSRVECIDILDFQSESFDTILMLMNGLGLAGNLNGLPPFLDKMKELLNPDGQLLVDSTDIESLRRKMIADGTLNPGEVPNGYPGEVEYRMEYAGFLSAPFQWLYIDQETLQQQASRAGWFCQIIYEEEEQYLARLIPF